MFTSKERFDHNLEHARWRVKFQESLLEAHRADAQSGPAWAHKDAQLFQALKQAKAALRRLEHATNLRAACVSSAVFPAEGLPSV
jgi:hypothetical protein